MYWAWFSLDWVVTHDPISIHIVRIVYLLCYVDSYGKQQLFTDLMEKLTNVHTKVVYHDIPLLGMAPTACGQYWLMLFLLHARGFPFDNNSNVLCHVLAIEYLFRFVGRPCL